MHTPGPWRVDLNPYDGEWRVYQVDGPPILNSLFKAKGPEGEANARLIAAAPALVALLDELFPDDGFPPHEPVARQRWIKARAAIAQVKGGS